MRGVIFFLMALFLFGDDIYKKEIIPSIDLTQNIKIKFSMLNYIKSADLDENEVIVGSSNKVKVYSLKSNDILETKNIELKKVKFSSDKSKILLLHKSGNFFVLDKNFKILKEIKGDFLDFDEKNGFLVLLGKNYFKIYDLNSYEEKASGKGFRWAKIVRISPSSKRFLIFANDNLFIFNNKGVLLNKIYHSSLDDIKWIDDRKILVDNGYCCDSNKVFIIDVINSKKIKTFSFYKYLGRKVNSFVILPQSFLVLSYNKMLEYNLTNDKIERIFYLTESNYVSSAKYYKNNLLVTYLKNGYVFSFKRSIKEVNSSIKKTFKSFNKTDKKLVDKKVKNEKPTLEIYASKVSGYAPLTVTFSLFAQDKDGKIIAYYMNINGKEYLFTKPRKITYTFDEPGEYIVMGAVKDNSGNITIKKIKIVVKEETFEDFKKHL